jgi:hypothetical protein
VVVEGEGGGVGEVGAVLVVLVEVECWVCRPCPQGTAWGRAEREEAGEQVVGTVLAFLVVRAWLRTGEGTMRPLLLEEREEEAEEEVEEGGGEGQGRWCRCLVSTRAKI